jgi:hypothetical protein
MNSIPLTAQKLPAVSRSEVLFDLAPPLLQNSDPVQSPCILDTSSSDISITGLLDSFGPAPRGSRFAPLPAKPRAALPQEPEPPPAESEPQPTKPTPQPRDRRNPKKVVRTGEVYFINGEAHKFYTNTRATTYDPEGDPVSCCPDTGAGICLINRHVIDTHFPNIPRQISKDIVNLSGVGDGPATTLFAHIPVRLLTTEGEMVEFTAEVYIVDELRCNILLGTSFLKPNKIDIIWSKTDLDFDHLAYDGKKIRISYLPDTKAEKQRTARINQRYRAQIYVAETVIIPPGHGQNIAVRYHILPHLGYGYLINPQP